jgi:hypothetical protein
MNKRLLILFFFVLSFSVSRAGFISLYQARQVAVGFINTLPGGVHNMPLSLGSDITINSDGTPVYYVINLEPLGFILVPACDAAPPVIGYSFENQYNTTNQPENFTGWMEGCAEIIRNYLQQDAQPDAGLKSSWDAYLNGTDNLRSAAAITAGPLLTSTWNQSYPYNYLCPADPNGSGGHVYAGCVATAMSQILYYWRYPQQGTGSHGYTWDPYGYLFADFGNTTYQWEQMENSTSGQNFEMAQLQLQLGISVDMMYSGSGSGAYSQDAAEALKTYFGYDQSLQLVNREDYAYEDWKTLLRTQIDAGQPMYYHGYGTGGHAFIVDGYQDTMYFHFNWGWGGSYNGYFHLFNLNPGGNTFNNGQGAIINFIPAGNNVNPCQATDTLTMLSGTLEDGSGPVAPYFDNNSCSWLIMPNDTLDNIKLTFHRFDLEENKDFIYVYDGDDTDAPLVGSFTGNSLPPVAVANSGKMLIRFVTDGSGTSNGWMASFSSTLAQFCSGTTTCTSPSGLITDGSGSYNYHNNTVCRYEIKPENAQSISLTFNELNTFDEGDFIAIYNNITHELCYKFFGQPNPGTLSFNCNDLMILFKTDQQNTAPGFSINYTSSVLTSLSQGNNPSGVLIWPNPASDYVQVSIPENSGIFSISLIAPDGKTVYSEESGSDKGSVLSRINTMAFSRGLYWLKVNSDKGTANYKLLLR